MNERTSLLNLQKDTEAKSSKFSPKLLLFVVASALVLFFGASAYTKKVWVESQLPSSPYNLDFEITNEYPPLSAKSSYPWPHIAEPYRDSTLTASFTGTNPSYSWIIYNPDLLVADGYDDIFAEGTGDSITVQFTAAGYEYSVSLTVTYEDDTTGEILTSSAKSPVIAKYVRRELRDLTVDDLARFYAALHTVMFSEYDEGQEIYGTKFTNYNKITIQHIGRESCTPFHGSDSFFPSHVGFNIEIEQAMQSVDPIVSLAYWDSSSDSITYGSDWKSEVFIFDVFGSANPENDLHVVDDGYFAYSPVAMDATKPNHNAYGIITAIVNQNPAKFVSRASAICGFQMNMPLPGCTEYGMCMAKTTLGTLDTCVEKGLHANYHPSIGGAWECPYSFADIAADNAELGTLLEAVSFETFAIWSTALTEDLVICPTDCSFENDPSECSCSSPKLDAYTDEELTAAVLATYLEQFEISSLSSYYETSTVDGETFFQFKYYDKTTESYIDIEADLNFEVTKLLTEVFSHPGFAGNMADGNAPNDPVFWILHPIYEKMLWNFFIDPELTESFDFTFSAGVCNGSGADDVLPFRNLLAGEDNDHYYTNEEMFTTAHPWRKELEYLYDTLDLPTCS